MPIDWDEIADPKGVITVRFDCYREPQCDLAWFSKMTNADKPMSRRLADQTVQVALPEAAPRLRSEHACSGSRAGIELQPYQN